MRDATRKPFGRNNIYINHQRRLKGSSYKIPVNCQNGIKLCNRKIGGVDLMDQLKSGHKLDQRSKFRFYLHLFFDMFDAALVNSFIVYKKLDNKDLTLKEFGYA